MHNDHECVCNENDLLAKLFETNRKRTAWKNSEHVSYHDFLQVTWCNAFYVKFFNKSQFIWKTKLNKKLFTSWTDWLCFHRVRKIERNHSQQNRQIDSNKVEWMWKMTHFQYAKWVFYSSKLLCIRYYVLSTPYVSVQRFIVVSCRASLLSNERGIKKKENFFIDEP